jgi:hypothetical protein
MGVACKYWRDPPQNSPFLLAAKVTALNRESLAGSVLRG